MELRRLFGKIFQRRQGPLCRLHFVQDQKRPPGQNPLARHSFQVREEMGRVCISVKAGRRPAVRFQIEIDNGIVTGFSELPQYIMDLIINSIKISKSLIFSDVTVKRGRASRRIGNRYGRSAGKGL